MNCNLLDLSAVSFDLGGMKKLIHAPNRILAQYCRRLYEKSQLKNTKTKLTPPLEFTNRDGVISKITYKGVSMTASSPNNMFMLENKQILKITTISLQDGTLFIQGNKIIKINSVYNYPTDSEIRNMWEIKNQPSNSEIIVPIHNIKCNLLKLQLNFDLTNTE